MDYQENILCNSHVNLDKVGASSMERKFHWQYYINILVSGYLLFNWQERLVIDEAESRSMEQKRYRRVLSILKSWYLKYSKYLESESKFKLSISKKMWQHVFRSAVRSYIFIFLGYIPGLYFFSLYVVIIHLLRRGEGAEIYCPLILDWIESTQAQILFFRQIQNGDTEPNLKYCLKEYFNTA